MFQESASEQIVSYHSDTAAMWLIGITMNHQMAQKAITLNQWMSFIHASIPKGLKGSS